MTTTTEAAKALGITPAAFRKRAKSIGVKAGQVFQTGKRGRPADYWSAEQVEKVAKVGSK